MRTGWLAVGVVTAVLLALAGTALDASGTGPQPPANPRPRIGLALGGGSALGFAHIGVLDWLEEHRIPIDAVAGTSVGSLVGGAFATGLSPDDIQRLADEVDWDLFFLTDVPFPTKSFRRKQDSRAVPSVLEFGLKGGFSLPRAINTGHQVQLLLTRLTLPYGELASFDDLPTPFRAVATDLVTARSIVLGAGSLATALQASMTLPAVFEPVTIGPYQLIDGGALNNVPANVVRGMGADLVVAVDVGSLTRSPRSSATLLDVLSRTIDTVMRENSARALAEADVIIRPDLAGLFAMDWRKAAEIRRRGYEAAERAAGSLLPLALPAGDYAAWRESRQCRRRPPPPPPAFITVTGVPVAEQAAIVRHLVRHLARPLDLARLHADLTALTGSDRYDRVGYDLVREGDAVGLRIRVDARKNGPPFLALAPVAGNTTSSVFSMSLVGRMTAYDIAGHGSEVRIDAAVGSGLRAGAELYVPILGSRWFVAPHASAERVFVNGFDADRLVAEYRWTRGELGGGIGFNSGRRSEVRADFEVSRLGTEVRVGDPALPEIRGTERVASLQWTFDNQDSPMVPSRGVHARARVRQFYRVADAFSAGQLIEEAYSRRFTTIDAELSAFGRPRDRTRLFGLAAGGTALGANPIPPNDFTLGGPLRLGAYHADEFRGSQYVLLTGGLLREVGRLPDMIGEAVLVGAWIENGATFESLATARWRTNVSGGLVLETFLGPVYAIGSVGLEGRARIYVGIGRLLR